MSATGQNKRTKLDADRWPYRAYSYYRLRTPHQRRRTRAADPGLQSLLSVAYGKLNSKAIINVLERKPSVASMDTYYYGSSDRSYYPMHIALKLGASLSIVKAFQKAFPIDDPKELHLACKNGAPFETISFLIEKYPESLKAKDRDWMMPLHCACSQRSSLQVVAILLEKLPSALDEQDRNGMTPLHHACRTNGNHSPLKVIALLLEKSSAATLVQDHYGCTPLHRECQCGPSLEVVSLLLEKCPSAVKVKTDDGKTPLHLACQYSAPVNVVAFLLDKYPTAAKEKDIGGMTPLHHACHRGSKKAMHILLEKWPAAVDEKDRDGRVPRYGYDCYFRIGDLLRGIGYLARGKADMQIASHVMEGVIEREWWGVIKIVFNRFPPFLQTLENIPTAASPTLLSMIGCKCNIKVMWYFIRNRQDLLNTNS